MPSPLTQDEFIIAFESIGALGIVRQYGINERNILRRRREIEARIGRLLVSPNTINNSPTYKGRYTFDIVDGTVLVGSDLHIWPGEESLALRAFKMFARDVQPNAIVLNGDVMDFPRISRHPQNWESAPDPQEEIEAAQDHLHDIDQCGKKSAHKIWTIGNHDQRFESAIANALPQFRGVQGVHLSDHFGVWQKAMSVFINGDTPNATMIKHRMQGGQHATYNNVKKAGTHVITGHLHAQNVRAVSDYRTIDLYGVDTGMMAQKNHSAFTYTEDAPVDWREGFALLTYRGGRLMLPELITKWDDEHVQFRGQLIRVFGHAKDEKVSRAKKAKAKA